MIIIPSITTEQAEQVAESDYPKHRAALARIATAAADELAEIVEGFVYVGPEGEETYAGMQRDIEVLAGALLAAETGLARCEEATK